MRAPTLAVALLAFSAALLPAQDVAGHLSAAEAARCRRNPQEALAHLRAALALDSLHYEANWRAARELADIGKMMPDAQRAPRDTVYAEARSLAERAVRVNANGADGHYMVAVAVGRVALTKGARERVRYSRVVRDEALRATELNPRHDGALHVLGRWNAEIQRLPGITKFFAKTFLGASIFNQASWDNAVRYFTEAIAANPTNIYHHLDLAEALIDADRAAEARPHLEQIATMEPACDPQDPEYKRQAAATLARISRR
jgi:tetratricopeptide (TPR) repeat protein